MYGWGGRIRTCALRYQKPLLYQLSYAPTALGLLNRLLGAFQALRAKIYEVFFPDTEQSEKQRRSISFPRTADTGFDRLVHNMVRHITAITGIIKAMAPVTTNRTGDEIQRLIDLMSKLPGLGPRSGRRAALHLIKNRDMLLDPLAKAMAEVAEKVTECSVCGAVDTRDPCSICCDADRKSDVICVVEQAGDLWALERAGAFKGRYHVLGGVLSALDGVGPDDLGIPRLTRRACDPVVTEVVLAMNATVDGQTTAYYIAEALEGCGVSVSGLAQGVPIGGELDYLDDGTISAAFRQRKDF